MELSPVRLPVKAISNESLKCLNITALQRNTVVTLLVVALLGFINVEKGRGVCGWRDFFINEAFVPWHGMGITVIKTDLRAFR